MNNGSANYNNAYEDSFVTNNNVDMFNRQPQLATQLSRNATETTVRVLDADIVIRGYERRFGWTLFVWLLIVLTAGMLGLVLLYWKPEWMLKLTHSVCPLATARLVYIEDAYQQKYVRKLYTTSSMSDASMQQTHHLTMFLPLQDSPKSVNRYGARGVDIVDDEGNVVQIESFRWFQFQKHKLILDPKTSTFRPLVGPNSISREQIDSQKGLAEREVLQRRRLFGKNELTVKVASPFRILVLEASNPFYIFQVYAFIVWYTEGYIYYGWAIVAMSALSLIYTTWQTNYLQRMRRDRFQSNGTVRVVRHHADRAAIDAMSSYSKTSPDRQQNPKNGFVNLGADIDPDGIGPKFNTGSTYESTVDSNQLVPGDVIIIPPNGCEMFCDAIILNGTCLVNEATLTGESIPVTKAAVEFHGTDTSDVADGVDAAKQQQRLFYLSPTSSAEQRGLGGTSKNMLYAGTKVIQTRCYTSEPVKAVVMRTGYCTVKGELVTSILYPKPVDFSFHNDALKFLIVLAVFACIGMVYTLVILKIRGSDNFRLALRALDIVTIVVPPALPFAMTMGIVHAQTRLRKAGLFCISPRMINMAGSINLVCFDKTGTLTEDGLTLRGVIPLSDQTESKRLVDIVPASNLLGDDVRNRQQNEQNGQNGKSTDSFRDDTFQSDSQSTRILPEELELCMSTCHELTLVDGKLTGDPLDLEMFRATGWHFEDFNEKQQDDQLIATVRPPHAASADDAVHIVRVMSFESKLQRMSVLIRRKSACENGKKNNNAAEFYVCCKGSPEKIASLCTEVPENFDEMLTYYTQNGDRVLALSYRPLDSSARLQRMSRDELERGLQFAGFIVFENRLKPQTIPCIRELKSACIRTVMVTGDNVLTALSVGRQCDILDTRAVSLLEVDGRQKTVRRRRIAVNSSAGPESTHTAVDIGQNDDENFALDGDTFQLLRDSKNIPAESYQQVLRHGTIYARMTPAHKELLVDDLRHAGYFVGMCGDGANDCGALKTAHMGISLSDQEASAAAPYTYKHANVSCVPTCIKEGRAALETSFGAFKFMAAYSLTQFLSVLILYETNTNISQLQFFYIDLFQATIIIIVFGLAKPFHKLVRTPPPLRLMGIIPLLSLALQIVIALAFQIGAYLLMTSQPWFVSTVDNTTLSITTVPAANPSTNLTTTGDGEEHYYSYQNYAVFSISIFQYVWLAIAFSRGVPYRRFLLTNWPLTLVCLAMVAFDTYLALKPCSWLIWILELKMPPTWSFRWYIIALAAANLFVAVFCEWWFMASLNKRLDRNRRRQTHADAATKQLPHDGDVTGSMLSPKNAAYESAIEMDGVVRR